MFDWLLRELYPPAPLPALRRLTVRLLFADRLRRFEVWGGVHVEYHDVLDTTFQEILHARTPAHADQRRDQSPASDHAARLRRP